jgi:hypothetical protein
MILDDTPRCACVCLYLLHVSYSEFSFSQQIRAVHTSTRMSSVVPEVHGLALRLNTEYRLAVIELLACLCALRGAPR